MSTRTDQNLAQRGVRPGIQLGAMLVIGLAIGVVLGRVTAPTRPHHAQPINETASVPDTPSAPDMSGITAIVGQAKEFLDAKSGDELAAAGEIIGNASISDLLDWSRSPERVSRRIINEMSDYELVSTITSITKLDAEELRTYSDLRGYANRLSHIAMSGVITDDISPEFDHAAIDVVFATGASSRNGAEEPNLVFDEDTRKIYAVIPNDETSGGHVMVHWYRVDPPEIMLFDQYGVSPQDEYSYVWLKPPGGHWDEGEYRVEFFSGDENLTPMAAGNYRVIAE